MQQIESDMIRYNKDNEVLNSLQQIKNYINLHLTSDFSQQNANYLDKVKEFEKKMFTLIDEISSFSPQNPQKKSLQNLKQDILSLIKEIAIFKQSLMKKINKSNEIEMKTYLNRLEDLQENLADLEYTFRTKHQVTPSLEEKVLQIVEDDRVHHAKKQHNSISLYNEL